MINLITNFLQKSLDSQGWNHYLGVFSGLSGSPKMVSFPDYPPWAQDDVERENASACTVGTWLEGEEGRFAREEELPRGGGEGVLCSLTVFPTLLPSSHSLCLSNIVSHLFLLRTSLPSRLRIEMALCREALHLLP